MLSLLLTSFCRVSDRIYSALIHWRVGCYCSVTKSHLALCNPMNCSPPVSSVHGISQARILEWVANFLDPWIKLVSSASLAFAGRFFFFLSLTPQGMSHISVVIQGFTCPFVTMYLCFRSRWKGIEAAHTHPGICLECASLIEVFFKKYINLFIWLCWVLLEVCEIFNLCCILQDLVPWPGIELWPPALGVWILRYWTTWEGKSLWLKSSVQLLSRVWLFLTPWTAAHQPSLSITNSWSLLELMSIESVMPSNHLILCPLLLLLPSVFPRFKVFSNQSVIRIRWPKYWSFSISPSNEYQDWFPLNWTGVISLQSMGLSRVFFNTTVQKHKFFGAKLSS